jgi:hypothetical protein
MDDEILIEKALIECNKGIDYKIEKIENEQYTINEFYLKLSDFCKKDIFLYQVDGKINNKVIFNICENDELHLVFLIKDINFIRLFLDTLLTKSTQTNKIFKNRVLESIYSNVNKYCEFKDNLLINIYHEFPV